jgi:hypothetical protein
VDLHDAAAKLAAIIRHAFRWIEKESRLKGSDGASARQFHFEAHSPEP